MYTEACGQTQAAGTTTGPAGAAAAAREGVASDNFGLDPKLQQGQLGSTDASADIAASLALEDQRIRVVRLPDRSGKPGRPLNAGMDAASAPWVER